MSNDYSNPAEMLKKLFIYLFQIHLQCQILVPSFIKSFSNVNTFQKIVI